MSHLRGMADVWRLVELFASLTRRYVGRDLSPPLRLAIALGVDVDAAAFLASPPEDWLFYVDTEPPCHAIAPWHVPLQLLRGCDAVHVGEMALPDRLLVESVQRAEAPPTPVLRLERAVEEAADARSFAPVVALEDDAHLAKLYALGAYQAQGGALIANRQLAALKLARRHK